MKYKVFCLLALLVSTASYADESKPFTGTIVYTQSAQGKDAEMFNGMAASKVTVHIGEKAYRQDEVGGLNEGSVIIRAGAKDAIRLNHTKKMSERGRGTNLEDMDPKMKKMMSAHFETPLEDTGESEEIAGFKTKKYKVLKSPFVREGAVAHVWVAEDLNIGGHRYDFQFKANRVVAPIPKSIPVKKGTILKAVVLERGTTVTSVVTSIDKKAPVENLFTKPDGYEGEGFPAPLKVMPAPTGLAPDVSKLAASISNSIGMKLMLIKPGTFTMGSPEGIAERGKDETQHEVAITRAYYLAVTEVTQAQWKAVMGTDSPSNFKGDDLPVEKVTWQQAVEFCKKLSEKEDKTYRLPTEAEWEYAARAGDASKPRSMREGREWLKDKAWIYSTAKYKTHPVGQLKANAWGFHDMLGNVGEFTLSGMGKYPEGKATDPQGMESDRKVVRGGGWISNAQWARYATRTPYPHTDSKSTIGFRVLCQPK